MSFTAINRIIIGFLLLLVSAFLLMRYTYVETEAFPDRTTMPILASTDMEVVADLPFPPGNIAVADNGGVFLRFTLKQGRSLMSQS
jgi:hypothetical protein